MRHEEDTSRTIPFGSGVLLRFGPQKREEDDVANRLRIGEQHRQAIDADSFAGGRRHSMSKRANVIEVDLLRNFVATLRDLREEAAFLSARFPGEYAAWAAEVPLFVPRLRPAGPRGTRFEWPRVRRNREWQTALALPAMAAVLWARAVLFP